MRRCYPHLLLFGHRQPVFFTEFVAQAADTCASSRAQAALLLYDMHSVCVSCKAVAMRHVLPCQLQSCCCAFARLESAKAVASQPSFPWFSAMAVSDETADYDDDSDETSCTSDVRDQLATCCTSDVRDQPATSVEVKEESTPVSTAKPHDHIKPKRIVVELMKKDINHLPILGKACYYDGSKGRVCQKISVRTVWMSSRQDPRHRAVCAACGEWLERHYMAKPYLNAKEREADLMIQYRQTIFKANDLLVGLWPHVRARYRPFDMFKKTRRRSPAATRSGSDRSLSRPRYRPRRRDPSVSPSPSRSRRKHSGPIGLPSRSRSRGRHWNPSRSPLRCGSHGTTTSTRKFPCRGASRGRVENSSRVN